MHIYLLSHYSCFWAFGKAHLVAFTRDLAWFSSLYPFGLSSSNRILGLHERLSLLRRDFLDMAVFFVYVRVFVAYSATSNA